MEAQPRDWRQPYPHIIWPVAALIAGAILLMAGLVWVSAVRQDELGLRHEKQVVTHAIDGALEDVALIAKGAKRKFCVWRSCGGVILGVCDWLSIAELDAFDDLSEPVGAVQAAPMTLSGFDQLEHHGKRGVA